VSLAARAVSCSALDLALAFGEPLGIPAIVVARDDAAGDGQDLAEVRSTAGHLGCGALQLAVERGVVEVELQAAGAR
jgi:hypothetical protein